MKKNIFFCFCLLVSIIGLSAQITSQGQIIASGTITGNLSHPDVNSAIIAKLYNENTYLGALVGIKGTISEHNLPFIIDSYPISEEQLSLITKVVIEYAGQVHEISQYSGNHILKITFDEECLIIDDGIE